MLVVCSPDSARSDYVNEEARLFKSRHPQRPVIPLIVGGKSGDPELECFPSTLKFKVDAKGRITKQKTELLAADARDEGDGSGKDLALAKIVAGILGLSPDDVFRRAERERRAAASRRRLVQMGFGALGWLLLAGLVGWINQDYFKEQWRWFTTIRPYVMSEFRPCVLTASAEQALKSGDTLRECAEDCPEMGAVPAGTFTMGSLPEERGRYRSEGPRHEVTIAKPFAVSKFEVTFDDWDACVAYGDCPRALDHGWGRGRQPVVNVSWHDVQLYVAWLSEMTGKTYRLLSEAEWEYAARAGTRTVHFWGDGIGKNNANCRGCGSQWDYQKTAPVGSFAANAFGLHDMAGNVWEWVEDCSHENGYEGAPDDSSAWVADGDCSYRSVRGGSWHDVERARSAGRYGGSIGNRSPNLGFRVARDLDR